MRGVGPQSAFAGLHCGQKAHGGRPGRFVQRTQRKEQFDGRGRGIRAAVAECIDLDESAVRPLARPDESCDGFPVVRLRAD